MRELVEFLHVQYVYQLVALLDTSMNHSKYSTACTLLVTFNTNIGVPDSQNQVNTVYNYYKKWGKKYYNLNTITSWKIETKEKYRKR